MKSAAKIIEATLPPARTAATLPVIVCLNDKSDAAVAKPKRKSQISLKNTISYAAKLLLKAKHDKE